MACPTFKAEGISRQLALAAGVALVSAVSMAASAPPSKAALTYFGWDKQSCTPATSRLGPGGTASGGCGESLQMVAYPNSVAAEKGFLSQLVGVQTETFQFSGVGAGQSQVISAANNNNTLPFNGGAVTGTAGGNVTMYGLAYNNGNASLSGGGQYGIAPNSQCTPQNANRDNTNCIYSQQNVSPIDGGSTPNPQNFLGVLTTATASNTFNISFSTPVSAFGFYGVDIGDFQGTLLVDFVNASGTTFATNTIQSATNTNTCNAPIPDSTGVTGGGTQAQRNYSNCNGSVLFYGWVGSPNESTIKQVVFRSTGGSPSGDFFAFDNFTVGLKNNVVPAPLPVAGMLPLGIALKSLARKRRKLIASSSS